MSFEVIRAGELEYLQSALLREPGVVHCFSTRYGGVSEGHLAALNLGIHRGDKPENVRENYRILGQAVGFRPEELVFTKQVHSDIVVPVGRNDCGAGLEREVTQPRDGLMTNETHVAVIAFSADCTPVLLLDPVRRVCLGRARRLARDGGRDRLSGGRADAPALRLPAGGYPGGHRPLYRRLLL